MISLLVFFRVCSFWHRLGLLCPTRMSRSISTHCQHSRSSAWPGARSNGAISNRPSSTCPCSKACHEMFLEIGLKTPDSFSRPNWLAEPYLHTQLPKAQKYSHQNKVAQNKIKRFFKLDNEKVLIGQSQLHHYWLSLADW